MVYRPQFLRSHENPNLVFYALNLDFRIRVNIYQIRINPQLKRNEDPILKKKPDKLKLCIFSLSIVVYNVLSFLSSGVQTETRLGLDPIKDPNPDSKYYFSPTGTH